MAPDANARQDPGDAAVPPLKPRPYYHAVRAYQRVRVMRSRLAGVEDGWQGVRILGYHRVTDASDVLAVTPAQFGAHLEALAGAEIEVITLARALGLLESTVSGRYVCITFDDAFADVAANAAPLLREHRFPATIFAATAVVDGIASFSWYRDPPPTMTWEQLEALAAEERFDIQSHTESHPRLPALTDERARAEIAGSKRALERRLAAEVTSLCYPAGLYGARELKLMLEAGYRAGITTRAGVNPGGRGLTELRRTMVGWREGRRDFTAKLAGALDQPAGPTEWMQRRRGRPRDAAADRVTY